MDWQQKYEAIKALSPNAAILMREPRDWYVHDSIYKSNGVFQEGTVEQEPTPEQAIEKHWAWLVDVDPFAQALFISLPPDYIGHYYRWNGYMWRDVTESFIAYHRAESAEGTTA